MISNFNWVKCTKMIQNSDADVDFTFGGRSNCEAALWKNTLWSRLNFVYLLSKVENKDKIILLNFQARSLKQFKMSEYQLHSKGKLKLKGEDDK